jgi:hypothetical protein
MRYAVAAGLALLWAAAARAELNCNVGVEFYPDGGVQACTLNGRHTLHTGAGLVVHCADGARAEQYPDGRLRRCTLALELDADGRRCAPGERVELDAQGRLLRCERP